MLIVRYNIMHTEPVASEGTGAIVTAEALKCSTSPSSHVLQCQEHAWNYFNTAQ